MELTDLPVNPDFNYLCLIRFADFGKMFITHPAFLFLILKSYFKPTVADWYRQIYEIDIANSNCSLNVNKNCSAPFYSPD